MEKALKEQCVPALRKLGFKGSFPNLYRDQEGFVSLINFQFYSAGGSLCVNLSYADRQRENVYFRPETPANKLVVSQTKSRIRLGAACPGSDRWFSFGQTSAGEFRGSPQAPADIAAEICQLLAQAAEPWWQKMVDAGSQSSE